MLEILKFYVSGFWTWAGITVGMSLFVPPVMRGVVELLDGFAEGYRRGRGRHQ